MSVNSAQELATRQRLERLTYWLDDRFQIPGTRWRIGLDFLIGLIPVGGDILGGLVSLWLVREASRLGAPRALIGRMLGNVGIELLVGLVPFLGDLFDAYWKSNRRNLRLLTDYLDARLEVPKPAPAPRSKRLLWLLTGLVIVISLLWMFLGGGNIGA